MTSTRAFPAPRAWLTIIVCALPLLGGCSSEAEPAPEPPRVALVEPLQAAEPKAEALRFSGVVQSVTSTQLSFEVAGRIERILVEKRGGKVSYAVLSFGGFLGIGHDHYPLPWSKLDYDENLGGYRVDITKDQLEGAPRYENKDDNFWTAENGRRVHDYYGVTPYWI